MKTKIVYTILCSLLYLGCTENEDTNLDGQDNRALYFKPVDPKTEVSRLSRELLINGENFNGDMPISGNTTTTFISGFSSSASITKDNILFLPISYQSNNDVVEAFIQLKNADNYWQLPVEPINNTTNLQIGIPSHVLNGNFNVAYFLKKSDGEISEVLETEVGVISAESNCSGGRFPTIEGNDGITSKTFIIPDVGVGILTVNYQTFTVPDRVDIRYNNTWIHSTGNLLAAGESPPVKECSNVEQSDGFLGTSGSFVVDFDTAISNKLDVVVSGCLNNNTRWTVSVNCPQTTNESTLWYEKLPDCPCNYDEVPENNRTEGFDGEWKDCNNASAVFHYGATYEIRWLPTKKDNPGQQCTYDSEGKLITSGIAAGSPDRVSPNRCGIGDFIDGIGVNLFCEKSNHCIKDVKPWKAKNNKTIPCTEYLKNWPANKGNCGNNNPVNDFSYMSNLVGNMSCEEVTTLLNIGSSNSFLVSEELASYLSGQNTNPPLNLKDMLKTLKSRLNCNNSGGLNPQACEVINKAILNLSS